VASDDTPEKQNGFHLWKPGQSGNPTGRPKGARSKLGEDFLSDLHQSWKTHGISAIERVIEKRPHEYLRVVASILPKRLEVTENPLDDVSDDELAAVLELARSYVNRSAESDSQPEEPVH